MLPAGNIKSVLSFSNFGQKIKMFSLPSLVHNDKKYFCYLFNHIFRRSRFYCGAKIVSFASFTHDDDNKHLPQMVFITFFGIFRSLKCKWVKSFDEIYGKRQTMSNTETNHCIVTWNIFILLAFNL